MFNHETVFKEEAIRSLQVKSNGTYVDCTLGGAGHSRYIASNLDKAGTLIALDQDSTALQNARHELSQLKCKIYLVKTNFKHVKEKIEELGVYGVDGILFDLGVSSPQLDESERGFSYHHEAPLDMRMDMEQDLTAYQIVNEWPEEEISRVLWDYGEERFARKIAKRIIRERVDTKVQTTTELAAIIKSVMPPSVRWQGTHPARRSFQAIRIAVNDELGVFQEALSQSVNLLKPGGRIVVITFHSLEDRICKRFFLEKAKDCICEPKVPICICNRKPTLQIITRKPVLPTEEEIKRNKRARSAKLRVAEKI